MALIRPRLTDYYNLAATQEVTEFAIPFLDEDIPLYVDPFLLWRSPSYQDKSLSESINNAFNHVGYLANRGRDDQATEILIKASECEEVGLGFSSTRSGSRIGENTAHKILELFKTIPQVKESGFRHFEEIQLFVDHISKDRVSDIACNFMKSFLIDYTIQQCESIGIPISKVAIPNVYDLKERRFIEEEKTQAPVNPENGKPILFVPKRWLRKNPWIGYDEYVDNFYTKEVASAEGTNPERIKVLDFNRHNYGIVQQYVASKERTFADCKNDPLFRAIPILSAKRKVAEINKLPTGNKNNADKRYETLITQLMASMLYPHLDFADDQVRTDSGTQIRDLIFYNNRSIDFLKDIYDLYGSRQIVFEMKNVHEIQRDHINQLNRYMNNELGSFGVFLTRNPLNRSMKRNIMDLWSGQRKCILVLTDEDINLMVSVFESQQRQPFEVLKHKYIEFSRSLPT